MDMVSNFRLKTLDPVQFPAIQTHSKRGTGEKRSGTENRTALLGECCHPKTVHKEARKEPVAFKCFHDNTSCHRSIQINIKIKNKDIINIAKKSE